MSRRKMSITRRFRKELTIRALQLGQRWIENGNEKSVKRIERVLRGFTRTAFPLRLILRRNLESAGFETDGIVDAYFDRGVDQMVMLANILRVGLPESGVLEKFEFDESLEILKRAHSKGKGVICI